MSKQSYFIKKEYLGSFDDAVISITQSLKNEGFGILTQIDVASTLKKKLNIEYPKYLILGACNPPNAHKTLLAEKEIGLLLPCNVIVYKENNKIYIAIIRPTMALTLLQNSTVTEIAKVIEEKLIKSLNKAINSNIN